jgi:hypothetical protein
MGFQTRRHVQFRQRCKDPNGRAAHKPTLFQFVPGWFHIDILLGRKPRADPKTS